MATRSVAVSARHSQRPLAPPTQTSIISNPSPRSGTPTKIHAPRSRTRHPSSSNMADTTTSSTNPSPPSTPTGRKRNTGRRRADARPPRPQEDSDEADTPEEDLMELLGMTTSTKAQPQEKGMLSISKHEIDAATKKPARTKRTPAKKAPEVADFNDANTPASSDQDAPRQSRRNKKANGNGGVNKEQSSGPNSRRKAKAVRAGAPLEEADTTFDVSNLSQSLPPSFFAESTKASKDSSWDMPSEATGSQPLNVRSDDRPNSHQWQQQLVAGDKDNGTRRSQRLANGAAAKNKKRTKAGGHDRRASHDITPTSNLTAMIKTASHAPNVPVSAFDSSIPFHTGFNVHRAPQTPIRHGNPSPPDTSGAISLPIVGEFPRLNKQGGLPLGVNKYAGPTFHNSPASGSLPAPDLDDF